MVKKNLLLYWHPKLRCLNYVFVGTQAQRYHQVGEAVPPLLTKAISDAIQANEEETEECMWTRV